MKTLVLGLGNPILGDDGVGFCVVEELKKIIQRKDVTLESAALAGLELLDLLSGYDRVIIIDAIQTGGRPGRIYRLSPDSLQTTSHAGTPHDVNFATALELGKKLNIPLPRKMDILAIEAADVTSFKETLTPDVAMAVPECVKMVVRLLGEDKNP